MDWQSVWDFIWKTIVVVGGTGSVVAAVSKFFANRAIEKHKAGLNTEIERVKAELGQETEKLKNELAIETESHKLKLKKQEILFQKEIEAATAFFALRRSIEPHYRHPDMDWDEAMEDVVTSFTDTEKRLTKYAAAHGAILSTLNAKELEQCVLLASTHQFAPHASGMSEAKDAASEMLQRLQKIEAQFVKELRT